MFHDDKDWTEVEWSGAQITKKEMTTEFCFLLTSSRPVSSELLLSDPDIVVDIHNFRLKNSTRKSQVINEDQPSKVRRQGGQALNKRWANYKMFSLYIKQLPGGLTLHWPR